MNIDDVIRCEGLFILKYFTGTDTVNTLAEPCPPVDQCPLP